MSLVLQNFFQLELACQAGFKKATIKLDLLTHIDMLLMVQKGNRVGICHSVYQYAKANNKCMREYNEDKESSDIQ